MQGNVTVLVLIEVQDGDRDSAEDWLSDYLDAADAIAAFQFVPTRITDPSGIDARDLG